MKPDILNILQELNFTEYEAKAYLTLLEKSPLSGYAVSLNSGVPRSKIYEVLTGLVSRGDVMVSQENTPLYAALPPHELISQRKYRTERIFEKAEDALSQFNLSAQNRQSIWNITGHSAIISRVKETIISARYRILLEIWPEDALELHEELQTAAHRNIEIIIISYGSLDFNFATVYQHDMSQEITKEYGGRWIVCSVDDAEVIAGIVSLDGDSRAAWTMHPGLIMPITEVIIHDLYIMEILQVFRPELEARFGPGLWKLHRKYTIGGNGVKNYLGSPK